MSDLVARLRQAFRQFPVIDDSPVELFQSAADRIEELKIEGGKKDAIINDLRGQIAGDTCNMCNWLERGDCHAAKEQLQAQLDAVRGLVTKWKNEEYLRSAGWNVDAAIDDCANELWQALEQSHENKT